MKIRSAVAAVVMTLMPMSQVTFQAQACGTPLDNINTPAGGLGMATKASLNQPIEIHDRYGKAYFYENPSNDAEKYVNLGFASLNVFHYLDAYRAFKAAFNEDNNSVPAIVGVIISIYQNGGGADAQNLAKAYYNKIEQIEYIDGLSEKDKAWAEVVNSMYISRTGFQNAIKELERVDGDNIELMAALNWILMSSRLKSGADVKKSLEEVLKRYPKHAGANHFLLHMAEGQNDIATAQSLGKILIKSSVGSAHGQHMFGHTLPQTGNWQEALDQFLLADQIHKDYAAQYNIPVTEDWHYAHNLDLMAATYLGLGDSVKALDLWSQAMAYDSRTIAKHIGLALAENNFQVAEDSLTKYGAMINSRLLKAELDYLKNGKKMDLYGLDAYEQILDFLFKIERGEANYSQLQAAVENYFTQSLNSGGFDGWSHSFVDMLRLRNIGVKLGITDFVKSIDEIKTKAENGTL